MPPPSDPQCATCKFYVVSLRAPTTGSCHRYPPSPSNAQQSVSYAVLPEVYEDHWCGEWAKRPGGN
jgi:hypothetical protein